jgi:hypothetical protein
MYFNRIIYSFGGVCGVLIRYRVCRRDSLGFHFCCVKFSACLLLLSPLTKPKLPKFETCRIQSNAMGTSGYHLQPVIES